MRWCAYVCVCVCLGVVPVVFIGVICLFGFLNVVGVIGVVGFCVSWFGCVRGCVVVFLGFGDLCFCVNLGLPFRAANPGNHAYHE